MKRVAPFLWLIYLVLPVEGWGLLHGRPLGGLDAVVLIAGGWLWWARKSLPLGWLALCAIIAKLALGSLLVPRGFEARYFANAEFSGQPERGTEPADHGYSRTDRRLSFGDSPAADLPVHFFNDIQRFNFYLPTDPARDQLPVSVKWDGWIEAPRDVVKRLYVRSPGGASVVSIGGAAPISIPASASEWTGYLSIPAGRQPIQITLAIPKGGARAFEAGFLVNGDPRPLDEAVIVRRPVSAWRMALDPWVRGVSAAFDAVVLLLLALGVLRTLAGAWRRFADTASVADGLMLAWAAVAVDGLAFAWRCLHRMVTLSGGDDWLSYETMARDIALNGLWMTNGAELGHGAPFYYQPLYPYFLAAVHWLFGDGLYGVYLVQRCLVGAAVIVLWRLTAALFGERVGVAGFITAVVVVFEKVAPRSSFVLNELIFVPLVSVWALLLYRLAVAERVTWRRALGVGVVGGLTTLARSPLLLAWAPVLLLLGVSQRPRRQALKTMAAVCAAMLAVTSLATLRNVVVSGQTVFVSSSGAINFFIGNQPPMKLVTPPEHQAQYDRWAVDPNVQKSLEYARQYPGAFFRGWWNKALYSLGAFTVITPERGRSVFYMAVAALGALGLVVLARGARGTPVTAARLLPMALALCHFAVLVIIFPTVHGDRLLLAFYVLWVPYAALAVSTVLADGRLVVRPLVGALAVAAVVGGCVVTARGAVTGVDVSRLTIAVGLGGVLAAGFPRQPPAVTALYGVAALVVVLLTATVGTEASDPLMRRALLLMLSVLGAAALVVGRHRRLHAVVAWGAVVFTVAALAGVYRFDPAVSWVVVAGLLIGSMTRLKAARVEAA